MKKETPEKVKSKKKAVKTVSGFSVVYPNSAGIDIGNTVHFVAIEDGTGSHEVREYGCFTCDLEDMVKWLTEKGITTVAMESTGVYWLSLYMMLEEAGIEVFLVNAKSVKNVTGRKKDDTDAI